jgi:hypothetical protein
MVMGSEVEEGKVGKVWLGRVGRRDVVRDVIGEVEWSESEKEKMGCESERERR